MPSTIGSATVSRFLNEVEAHKLHLEFTVAAGQSVNAGDQVIFANNGTVQSAGTAAAVNTVIGVALHAAAAGEKVTIGMRPYCVVIAEAAAINLNAGPVQLGAWNGTTGRREFAAAAGATAHERHAVTVGFNLTQATADGEEILVALL